MLVVFLGDLAGGDVVLQSNTLDQDGRALWRHQECRAHLDNLFVTHAGQEDALATFVFLGEPFDNVGHPSIAKRPDALACFSVPEFYLPVVAGREETGAIGREGDILECTCMP